jgi:hypothetical protein
VTSHTTASFWRRFKALPPEIQSKARLTFHRFRADPKHPSLGFKKLQGCPDYWSVRVSLDFRAVAVQEKETLIWFWIGTHREFDRTFS